MRSEFIFNCSTNIVGGGVKNSGLFIKYLVEKGHTDSWLFCVSRQVASFICKLGVELCDRFVVFNESPAQCQIARKQLRKTVYQNNPHLVYTMAGPAYVSFQCYHVQGISNPYITHAEIEPYLLRENWLSVSQQLMRVMIQRWYSKWADLFIFQTEVALQGYCQRTGILPSHCLVVPNAFDRTMLEQSSSSTKNMPSEGPIIVFCPGVGYPHKGLQFIPEVAAALKHKSNRSFRFVLTIKDGWLQQRIMKKSHQLDVASMVVNEGPYNYSDVVERYQKADLVFVPSLLETFSASYLEAMAMEKPLIVADRPFARDICSEAALYVQPQDAMQTAEVIQNLCNQPELSKKLISNGREILDTYGDQETRCEHLVQILYERAEIS